MARGSTPTGASSIHLSGMSWARVAASLSRAHMVFAQSWAIGFPLTERLGPYTEWFALIPPLGNDSPERPVRVQLRPYRPILLCHAG